MGYIAILIITIFCSFIVVRIGGLALQLTGIEPDVPDFRPFPLSRVPDLPLQKPNGL